MVSLDILYPTKAACAISMQGWLKYLSIFLVVACRQVQPFNIADYTHYIDYLPYRQDGSVSFEDFRTAINPPLALRNRKMEIGELKLSVEEVLANPIWPKKWPYVFEDFRPLDYTRDKQYQTLPQYAYSQT